MQYPAMESESWWVLAIGGVVNILFGLAALLWPGLTLVVFIWLFGIYAIVYGIVELVHMIRAIGAQSTWWTYLLVGIFSILAGVVVFAWPGMTTEVLAYAIAVWAIVIGLVEIVGAFSVGRFLLAVVGVVSVLFGFVLLSNPLAGALALVMVIGAFAIVRGIILLIEAVRAPTA
ncbi:MAG: HdeD family acid-resistance protein [Chloroflexota bacterium]|nr:MAG: HdeD family acid-resistance protein [Chloroflexota bacterium]